MHRLRKDIKNKMDKEFVKSILQQNGYEVILDKPYKKVGYRLKVKQGSSVICFNSGKIAVFGKLKTPLESLLNEHMIEMRANDKVFIVYGHDEKAKTELEQMVFGWGLIPLMINQLPTEGRTIIEQLEHYIPQCNFGIVLATPDDIGYDKSKPEEQKKRARQNVVLELGMLYSKLGRKRVAVIIKKDDSFEKPSDIDGVMYFVFKENVNEVESGIRKELKNNGYKI